MAVPGPRPQPVWVRRIGPWGQAALDVLFPPVCRLCEQPLPFGERHGLEEWFCRVCRANLPRLEAPFCQVCGEAFDGSITGPFRCGNCTGRRFAFEFAIAGYRADGPVRELVHRFKYGRDITLRHALAALLGEALEDPRLVPEDLSRWLLVPVPLHPSRERDREFNQSWELCRRLAQKTGLQALNALARVRRTDSQASLDRVGRLRNLRGAFALASRRAARAIKDRPVLLVDDVFTTGATTHACARTLRQDGGAQKVVVITVARG